MDNFYKGIIGAALVVVLVFVVWMIVFFKTNSTPYSVKPIYLEDKYYNEGKYVEVSSDEINNMKKENYVLFTYNSYCAFSVPCENVFEEYMVKHKVDFLAIPFDKFKDTYLYEKIKYGPSVIVVSKGKIIAYLDANEDKDLDRFQKVDAFEEWIETYIYNTKS